MALIDFIFWIICIFVILFIVLFLIVLKLEKESTNKQGVKFAEWWRNKWK